MKKGAGILLSGLIILFSASNSAGSPSIEELIHKRVEMFKSSGKNIKTLNKLIRSGENSRAMRLLDFHVTWSKNMPLFFPLGSEASVSNGSDASSDIWDNPVGFNTAIKRYNLASKELKKALNAADQASINRSFKSLISSCKGCHKQFRN